MKLSTIALSIAIIAALALAVAGPGTRIGLWQFGTGFLLLRVALFVGLAAALLALVLLVIPKTRAGSGIALAIALLIGLGTAWVPFNGYRTAKSLPFIHDITTDTINPPMFVAVVPLRADASNPPDYAGEEVAAQQRQGYPDIQTLALADPPAEAMRKALKTAEDMDMDIVAVEPKEGRIEATATTFWFGFKDDVVIRIVADGSGSRLDIRSKSRVGRSDVGANAARIRRFMRMFKEQA
ncbi:MAG TPA: DUF1499 domain-containing protein [Woeseiaceae bacterium]|nr:DUF1499 domain-containing protein [Woeseiaceae bacterium]